MVIGHQGTNGYSPYPLAGQIHTRGNIEVARKLVGVFEKQGLSVRYVTARLQISISKLQGFGFM